MTAISRLDRERERVHNTRHGGERRAGRRLLDHRHRQEGARSASCVCVCVYESDCVSVCVCESTLSCLHSELLWSLSLELAWKLLSAAGK